MKTVLKAVAGICLLGLAGCRSLGYNDNTAYTQMTPGISEKQYVRTWEPNGTKVQSVVDVPVPASVNDPSYPNYTGPGSNTPPPPTPSSR